jgi:hypothetical protein
MTLPLIGVVTSYVVIAVLLLSLNLASHWQWWVKATAIAVTSVFFGLSYVAIAALLGWPSESRLPERFQLHWAAIVEPDKANGLPGSIYLWTEVLNDNNLLSGTPRAFRVPFSRELADRIQRAKKRIEEGVGQIGTLRAVAAPEGEPEGDQHRVDAPPRRDETGSPGDPDTFIRQMPLIDFEDLPPPVLPAKPPP